MLKPILVFGYGNPSRGDDALGPELLESLQCAAPHQAELLSDFQLQIEHALDLAQRRLVLFADASVSCAAPYEFGEVQAACDRSYSTHAMSPAALLQVYRSIEKTEPPPAFLLSIRGEGFELGRPLSAAARRNLRLATQFAAKLLHYPSAAAWRSFTGNTRPPAI